MDLDTWLADNKTEWDAFGVKARALRTQIDAHAAKGEHAEAARKILEALRIALDELVLLPIPPVVLLLLPILHKAIDQIEYAIQ